MAHSVDAALLCGLLAVKLGYVDESSLARCLDTWASRKDSALVDVLRQSGCLTEDDVIHLSAIVEHQLARHGTNAEMALQKLPVEQKLVARLSRTGDGEILAALSRVGSDRNGDPNATLPPSTSIAPQSRFEILNKHREGGLGVIFRARDCNVPRTVALKEILPKYAFLADSQRRFLLEGEVTGALEHPGIVPVYDIGRYSDGRPYYAMRFIEGQSLADAIKDFHKAFPRESESADKRLCLRKLLRRFQDLCNAVAYAHSRGVLHRDIKPDNVMLGTFGETLVVDWGLAKYSLARQDSLPSDPPFQPSALVGNHQTHLGSTVGTRGFMSPEQATGRHDLLTPASDVYSLGVTLWVLLTNEPPFHCGNCEEALSRLGKRGIPLPLLEMCRIATSSGPEQRYSNARDFAEQVEQWLADEPLAALREEVERVAQLVRSNPDGLELQEGLARHRTNLALVLSGTYRHAEATGQLHAAIEEYEQLINKQPSAIHLYPELVNALVLLGRLVTELGQAEESAAVRSRTEEWISRFAREREKSLQYRSNVADIHLSFLGRIPSQGQLDRDEKESALGLNADTYDLLRTIQPFYGPSEGAKLTVEALREGGYTVVRRIGQGGFATILLALEKHIRRSVVLKIAKDFVRVSRAAMDRFTEEARIMAMLNHPSIPTIFGMGVTQDDLPFISMEHIDGPTFDELLWNRHYSSHEGMVSLLRILCDVCRTLSYAHSCGVVHGDPKPANVIVQQDGRTVLLDWGLAVTHDMEEDDAIAGELRGTPLYISPEQCEGDRATPSTDVYSLGVILFEILTGVRPFKNTSVIDLLYEKVHGRVPRAVAMSPNVPPRLNSICEKAMARLSEDRYESPDSMADDIIAWLNSRP